MGIESNRYRPRDLRPSDSGRRPAWGPLSARRATPGDDRGREPAAVPRAGRPRHTRGMGERDDFADDDRPHHQDSPLVMPASVVAVLVVGGVVGLLLVALYARVSGVPQ